MDTVEAPVDAAPLPPEMRETAGSPRPPAFAPGPGLLSASWGGATRGFVLMNLVARPIVAILVVIGLVFATFGWASGRGWLLHGKLIEVFAAYFGLLIASAVLGGVIGAIPPLILRAWPDAAASGWWAARRRPIQFFARSRPAIDAGPRRRRRRLWPWLAGAAVALLLATSYALGALLGRYVDRRLDNAITQAARDDPNWQIDDLMAHREPVPEDENSSIVVAKILEQVHETWPKDPRILPGEPARPQPEAANAYDRSCDAPENVRLDDTTAETLRDELKTHEDALRLARTVAHYERGRRDLEISPKVIDTPLIETGNARAVARLLAADAAVRAHDGDIDGALESSRAILGVARSIGDEPFGVSQFVRVAIGQLALKSARRAVGQGEASDAAMARFQALALDEMDQPLVVYALRGERALLVELIRRIGDGELPPQALGNDAPVLGPNLRYCSPTPWAKLWYDNQRAIALEWMNESVAMAKLPPAERPRSWQRVEKMMALFRGSRIARFVGWLPRTFMPAARLIDVVHSNYQADLGATALLMAAERHRRAAGRWPESVEAIDPAILLHPPLDPFSGRPFLLDQRDGRIVAYSVGANFKDEHGAFEPKHRRGDRDDDVSAVGWDVTLRRQTPGVSEPEGASQGEADAPDAPGTRPPSSVRSPGTPSPRR